MKALHVDFLDLKIWDEVEVKEPLAPVDGLYYQTSKGILPIAYLIDPARKEDLEVMFRLLRKARKDLKDLEYRMFSEAQTMRVGKS